ncbi:cell division protein FtsA [Streptococcus entericus]|uniref:cell division protein FtsA n=1 Tax=Streptococcus entericus TaxID=155680 RepID=UPI00037DDA60|nr:cell division protein FtsA [Streptococcus entericus]
MARNGFFTGLDIGTSSIKVLVAEFVNGQMNVIGASNVPSAGVKDGIVIDIEAAAASVREAIEQAEEKAGVSIDKVSVALPAQQIQMEPTQGMIPIAGSSKEIRDEDVENVIKSALTKNVAPEREVISLIPEEFTIDGFKGIRDPRGMMGIRLEMRGTLYTGPSTVLHNLRKAIERAGLKLEHTVISSLALTGAILNEGEREFGATVIDMGAGQTTISVIKNQQLQHNEVFHEGGDYVTKDISKVLKTSIQTAETLKYNFGSADLETASQTDVVQVDVVGSSQPLEVTEHYLAEIIVARIRHILDRVYQTLNQARLLDMPGGIVVTGGGAILPGVADLAQQIFGVPVKLHIPHQVGIRNPIFSTVISLVETVGQMSDVDIIAQAAVSGEELLRRKPIEVTTSPSTVERLASKILPIEPAVAEQDSPQSDYSATEETAAPKKKLGDRFRGLFDNLHLFD